MRGKEEEPISTIIKSVLHQLDKIEKASLLRVFLRTTLINLTII